MIIVPAYALALLGALAIPSTIPAANAAEPVYTALKVSQVVAAVEKARLTYKGHALLFGSGSLETCIYAGPDLIVLESYCYPKRPQPARAFSVWSRKLGMFELYEETLDPKTIKRDVRQNEFPQSMQQLLPPSFSNITVESINSIMTKVDERHNPACWSTNFDWNTQLPTTGCLGTDKALYSEWEKDSQRVVMGKEWNEAFARINKKLGITRRRDR